MLKTRDLNKVVEQSDFIAVLMLGGMRRPAKDFDKNANRLFSRKGVI